MFAFMKSGENLDFGSLYGKGQSTCAQNKSNKWQNSGFFEMSQNKSPENFCIYENSFIQL